MIFELYIAEELQNVVLILFIFAIASFIAFKFDIKNIYIIIALILLIILMLYFIELIQLDIAIFAFLMFPLLVIYICRSQNNENS